MTARPLPPVEFLRECFRYEPDTGLVWWRARPEHHFPSPGTCAGWNAKFAGSRAFTSVDPEGGYLRTDVVYEGSRYRLRANRAIWKMATGEEPEIVDHKDLNTANNRLSNLRASDSLSNSHNAPGRRNRDLPKCVYATYNGKFVASSHHNGRKIHIGTFTNPFEAHEAYCAWARPLHGEFFNPGPNKLGVFG